MTRYRITYIVILLTLAAAVLACGGRGGGGRGSHIATATAYAGEYATAVFGAEEFHAQLTLQAEPQK